MKEQKLRRKRKIRMKIHGHANFPRLSFYKSLQALYVQAINDDAHVTLFACHVSGSKNMAAGKALAEKVDKKMKELKIERLVFDRNGLAYHGVVKNFCDTLRKLGVQI